MENRDSQTNSGAQHGTDTKQDATQQGTTARSEIKLKCFQGNTPPPEVVDGWQRLIRFPVEARGDFWTLLQSALVRPNNAANEQLLKQICAKYEIAEADVIAALGSCNLLFRQASVLNMDRAAFQQDLATLSAGDSGAGDFILEHFKEVKVVLRQQIVLESLADHGKVIVGLDWRVDDVSASDRGAELNTKVVFLTLRYRDGDRRERITFQLVPETVKELKNFCNRFSM